MEVLRFLVIFSFVSVIFSLLRYHVHASCDTSNDVEAQIACHRVHIGKAYFVCVLRQYASLAANYHRSIHYQHILDEDI